MFQYFSIHLIFRGPIARRLEAPTAPWSGAVARLCVSLFSPRTDIGLDPGSFRPIVYLGTHLISLSRFFLPVFPIGVVLSSRYPELTSESASAIKRVR